MASTKNPEHQAEHPAPMPASHARMAPRHDAPPGLETDGHGNVIPLGQRTREDRDKAIAGKQGGAHGDKKPS